MAVLGTEQLPSLLAALPQKKSSAYLLFGEPYLCRAAAERIEAALLNQESGAVHSIDGDQEDQAATLAKLQSFSLLPGVQIYRVNNTRLFHSKNTGKNLWERVEKLWQEQKPEAAKKALLAFLQLADLEPEADALTGLSAAQWQKSFGFAAPAENLDWTKKILAELYLQTGPKLAGKTDLGNALMEALERGIPAANVLILLAAEVDKRKKLFKYLKDNQTIVDLSVAEGASTKAKEEQKGVLMQLAKETLAEQGKTLPQELLPLVLERVGFHPAALVTELRKLMLATGESPTITKKEIDALLGQTRQEALFELTTAIGEEKLGKSLLILSHLLENSIHPLAIVATLRNFTRNLLLFKALQEDSGLGYSPAMPANLFQQNCLPLLKARSAWEKELSIHPFALYMQFKTAAQFPLATLCGWMGILMEAEFRLKGSQTRPELALHRLISSLLLK